MRRIVVLGGTGFFGSAAIELLRSGGLAALSAARGRGADLRLDAENPASLRAALRRGDIVLDAAGPFQRRTMVLVETAVTLGFDVVDIADALGYVEGVRSVADGAARAGVRLFPACSTASVISSALLSWSGVERPVRLSALLVPTTRRTAVAATAVSLLSSVGRPIRVLRDGAWTEARGFGEVRRWGGSLSGCGGLFETPDGVMLPEAHPALRTAEWFVDPNIPGLRPLLSLAARHPFIAALMARTLPLTLPVARLLGSERGGIAAEVAGSAGEIARLAVTAPTGGYRMAVIPAVMAIRALAEERIPEVGVVPVHRQVEPIELLRELERLGFVLDRA